MSAGGFPLDLNQTIKSSPGKKKKEFKGKPFRFEERPKPLPLPRSPQM